MNQFFRIYINNFKYKTKIYVNNIYSSVLWAFLCWKSITLRGCLFLQKFIINYCQNCLDYPKICMRGERMDWTLERGEKKTYRQTERRIIFLWNFKKKTEILWTVKISILCVCTKKFDSVKKTKVSNTSKNIPILALFSIFR